MTCRHERSAVHVGTGHLRISPYSPMNLRVRRRTVRAAQGTQHHHVQHTHGNKFLKGGKKIATFTVFT